MNISFYIQCLKTRLGVLITKITFSGDDFDGRVLALPTWIAIR